MEPPIRPRPIKPQVKEDIKRMLLSNLESIYAQWPSGHYAVDFFIIIIYQWHQFVKLEADIPFSLSLMYRYF